MTEQQIHQLGFIGLGTMGSRMVKRVSAAGLDVRILDVDPAVSRAVAADTGAVAVASNAELAHSDAVVLMVPNSAIVESVLGLQDDPRSLVASLQPGTLVIDMSSSDPESTRRMAQRLNDAGLRMIDAPVSGGPSRAATGELTIMVGGEADDVEYAGPLLRTIGNRVTHTGPVGSAHALKALNNLLSAIGIVGALEVLAVGKKFGLDPQLMLEVINTSTGRNHATEVKIAQQVLTRDWNVGFSLELTVKDIQTAQKLASSVGVEIPVSDAAVEVFANAKAHLEGRPDQSRVAEYLEDRYSMRYSD